MKTRSLAWLFLLVVSAPVWAQPEPGTLSLIPRLGVSIADLSRNDMYVAGIDGSAMQSKSQTKPGFVGGLEAEYQYSALLAFSAGVHYSQEGCRYASQESLPAVGRGFGVDKRRCYMDYVQVPLLAHVYVAPGFAVKAGVQTGFLVKSRHEYEETEITVDNLGGKSYGKREKLSADMKNVSSKTVVSIPVGVSYEYMNVVLDARYNIGLTKCFKKDFGASKSNVLTITAGYRFKL